MPRRRIEAFVGDRDPAVFARNVRRLREIHGWTRQELCQRAGMSPQTLARIERGEGCTHAVERKIADAVGTVVGRLWEPQELPRATVRTADGDRWYFASHEEYDRFRRAQDLQSQGENEPARFDPEAIQDESERMRMGHAGLAAGFVRVATGHLLAGSIVASFLEVYGRMEAEIPAGRLVYFHTVRGAIRFGIGDEVYEVGTGDVLLAEIASPCWIEPKTPLRIGEAAPRIAFVDLQPRRNPAVAPAP